MIGNFFITKRKIAEELLDMKNASKKTGFYCLHPSNGKLLYDWIMTYDNWWIIFFLISVLIWVSDFYRKKLIVVQNVSPCISV